MICICLTVVFCAPAVALAAAQPITRRDGFLALWQSIRRPIESNYEKQFSDVEDGTAGYDEIKYAKYRGILSDENETFRPSDPLMLSDALLLLYRTRSVDDIKTLVFDALPSLLKKYPLGDFVDPTTGENGTLIDHPVTEQELLDLMRKLDGQLRDETHEVSLYSEKFHGKGTAFGETFDMNALTAAHRTFPHNTLVRVTNVENGKSVMVRINDRGPYVEGRDMDLSLASFLAIAERSKGKIHARFERLGDSTLVSLCGDGTGGQKRIARGILLKGGVPTTMRLEQQLIFRSDKTFLLRSVFYPDGNEAFLQNWIFPGEKYAFKPSVEGKYRFVLGTKDGRRRTMETTVARCDG